MTEDGAISWEIRVNVRNTLESYHAERRNYRLSGDNYTLHVDGSIDYMMNEESEQNFSYSNTRAQFHTASKHNKIA